ncbi:MAG: glycosyltransferase family A protein [Lentisphaerota bacterium]
MVCSIIIRCYNEAKNLERLLVGLRQQSLKEFEIIVVDSGSTDGTLAVAKGNADQIATIKPSDFSFGRALNLGCQLARSEFIVIVSAHVYPMHKDWLEHLLLPFSDPKVALVYGKQRGDKTTRFSESEIFKRWFPDESTLSQPHPFCNNANAVVRRSVWNHLRYDETLTGLEDLAWARQALQLGYRIAYSAEAEIIHVHQETPQRIFSRYQREAMAMKRIFPEQRFSLLDFTRLFLANVFFDSLHAFQQHLLKTSFRDIAQFRRLQFWGTYCGYRQVDLNRDLRQRFYYPNTTAIAPVGMALPLPIRPAVDYSCQPKTVT